MRELKEIEMNFDNLPQDVGECLEVNTHDKAQNQMIRDTVVDLKNAIKEKNLDGLAAPSIGVKERIMVLNYSGSMQAMLNPVLIKGGDITLSREFCIHLPGKEYMIPRHKEITIAFETPLGQIMTARFIGRAAFVVQHLINHMDGMFVDDIGFEIDSDWDEMSDEDKTEIIKEWLESVDLRVKDINEELANSKEANKLMDAIEFEKKVISGEVELKEEKRVITVKEENDEQDIVEERTEQTN